MPVLGLYLQHFQKIIVALAETDRLIEDIDNIGSYQDI
jgi:hypothetical protein